MSFKIGFEITKMHPYKTDGDASAQCYMALIRELASNPAEIYNKDMTKPIYHICPKTGNRYKIELIFRGN